MLMGLLPVLCLSAHTNHSFVFTAIHSVPQDVADRRGYQVVRNFCGHGTGKYIHMDPLVSVPPGLYM
jgi:methionine aminopeptidase